MSKFDEREHIFTEEKIKISLPSAEENSSGYYSQVLLDNNEIFWVLNPEYGIYRYDPQTKSLDTTFDLPSGFRCAEIAANGTIYVLVYDEIMIDGEFQIEAALNYYDTSTGKVNEHNLAYLLEPYPVPMLSLFIDHQKRIWLDNFAYQDKDGVWYQPQRSPLFISPIPIPSPKLGK